MKGKKNEVVEVVEVVEEIKGGEIKVEKVEKVEEIEFKSKSEKIRYLSVEKGMRNSEIAKLMGIRDQFVSNVLRKMKDDLLLKEMKEKEN